MRVNYHTHTYRCKHAFGTEEDYIISAIKHNVQVLGFSDHAPFPYDDFGLRMSYKELPDYIHTLDTLKENYQTQISIHKGLEIEYFPKYVSYYEDLLTKQGLDYLVLGEHQYINPQQEHKNIFFADSTEAYIDYANAIAEALDTGYFKILAHPDLCMINSFGWDDNCQKAFDIILNAVTKNHTILEYNANGLRRGMNDYPDGSRLPYPHKKLWNLVKDTNIPVTVGSDCHKPEQMWDFAMDQAFLELEALGITPVENIF